MKPKGPSLSAALGALLLVYLFSRNSATAATAPAAKVTKTAGAPIPDQATKLQTQQNSLLASILKVLMPSSSSGNTTTSSSSGSTGGTQPTPSPVLTSTDTTTKNEPLPPNTASWTAAQWRQWAHDQQVEGAPFRAAAVQGHGGSLSGTTSASGGFNSGSWKLLQKLLFS